MMKRFYGGVRPVHGWPEKNTLLEDSGGFTDVIPAHVVLPMQQGAGTSCEPTVTVGENVKLGQLVGASSAKISSPIHASVSGTVTAIETRRTVRGESLCVVVENDGMNTLTGNLTPAGDPFGLEPAKIVDAVHGAGIMGMGGAAFPTHVKLQPQSRIDLVVVNGCECEPMLAADDVLMQQSADMVVMGCKAALKAVGANSAIIAVEDGKQEAIAALRRMVTPQSEVRICELPTFYPQGGEKQLIQAVSGREVPDGGLAADAGVLVLNAATCAAIAQTLCTGLPLVRRIATVTGAVRQPRNLRFPIGTTAAMLVDACGGFNGTPSKVIAGGPMMGSTVDDLSVPMLKGANGLVVVNEKHDTLYTESPCIRCNRCAQACPMRLMPLFLDRAARQGKLAFCERFHAQSCINCGCCTYVCPARRRLAETITDARARVLEKQKEAGA